MHSLLHSVFTPLVGETAAFWFALCGDILALLHIPSVIARREGRPLAALAWILGLLAIPFGGVILWWFLGRTHLNRPRLRRRRSLFRFRASAPGVVGRFRSPGGRVAFPFPDHARRWDEGLYPPVAIPSPEILEDEEAFRSLETALAKAEGEIRILFYIWKGDATGRRIRDILCERAQQGVAVFVLLDGMGARRVAGRFMDPLRRAGGKVAVFLPVRFRPWAPNINFRNHRKLVLVDGRLAITGGMNIGDEYRNEWHDFLVRFRGSVLALFDEVFREDWHFATGQVLPPLVFRGRSRRRTSTVSGRRADALCTFVASGPDRLENRAHDALFALVTSARRRVWLTTPYFVPGTALLVALKTAALRGVDVRILTPAQSDVPFVRLASRSYHRPLLEAGMRVFEYEPRVLHGKSLLIDEDIVALGSANADVRSFRMNFEVVCFVRSRPLTARVAAIFERDLAVSTEISEAEVRNRSRLRKQLELAAQMLAPIL